MTRCWLLIMIKLVSHFNRVNFLFDRFVPSQKFVRILWGKMPITILSTYFYKYFDLKQIPNFLSRHQKGPRPSAHCTLYIDSCTDTLYYCTHLVQMDCTCVYKTVHCCTTWHYLNTHLWCTHYARISYTAVHLYCSPVSVHSGTALLCIQLHCITVHSLVPDWPLFCQPITEELRFTCFALIGPLGIITPIPTIPPPA